MLSYIFHQYVVIYFKMYFRIYFKILQNWPFQICQNICGTYMATYMTHIFDYHTAFQSQNAVTALRVKLRKRTIKVFGWPLKTVYCF